MCFQSKADARHFLPSDFSLGDHSLVELLILLAPRVECAVCKLPVGFDTTLLDGALGLKANVEESQTVNGHTMLVVVRFRHNM